MTPREIACQVLQKWHSLNKAKRPPLQEIINNISPLHISKNDRAFVMEVVFGVVRWLYLLNHIISLKITKNHKIHPLVRSCLLSGLYELLFLNKPEYATINEWVELVKRREKWATGFVNALLRSVSNDKEKWLPNNIKLNGLNNLEKIAVKTSHTNWMVKRWFDRFGEDLCEEICRINNTPAPFTIRTNTLKTERNLLIQNLREKGIDAREGILTDTSIIIRGEGYSPTDIPFFDKGHFFVQDESSQLVSVIAEPKDNENILDLCAGLGGKTTHLAQITGDKGNIYAYDIDKRRIAKLKENLNRLEIKSIKIIDEADEKFLSEKRNYFHCVLVDAPCSGLGTIRRHPDIKWNRDLESINSLYNLQLGLLRNAGDLVKKGGRIVYSVCSFEEEETHGVIRKFLMENPHWKIKKKEKLLYGIINNGDEGTLTLITRENEYDGFFICVLERVN